MGRKLRSPAAIAVPIDDHRFDGVCNLLCGSGSQTLVDEREQLTGRREHTDVSQTERLQPNRPVGEHLCAACRSFEQPRIDVAVGGSGVVEVVEHDFRLVVERREAKNETGPLAYGTS